MITTITLKKNNFLKLTKALMVGALMCFGFEANAQCSANYTYVVDPSNNGDVTFTNASSGGTSGTSYFWSFGDGTGGSYAGSFTHNFTSTGTYTVCMTMNDSLATCNDSVCIAISVTNSGPAGGCNASFIPYDSMGYGYFYNNSTGTSITSTWDFGDGNVGTSTGDITHLYATPGTYWVCLTINNGFLGCSDGYCDSIVIGSSASGSCLGIVDASFGASTSGLTASFNNTPTGPGQVYNWDFGDGSSSPTPGNVIHTYGANGTYMVCLTVYTTTGTADSCQYCSYVTVSSGGVSGLCDATFNIVQDSSNAFNYFVYPNFASGSTYSYLWDFGDGTTSSLQYPAHTYADTIDYVLCLTVTNSAPMFGCSATYCDTILAGRASSTGITIQVLNATTGINESTIATVLENYPNPFSSSTTINYTIAKDATIELSVIDLLGNTVANIESGNKSAGSHAAVWNAEGVAEGMYLLQMKTNNQVTTKKIVLSK